MEFSSIWTWTGSLCPGDDRVSMERAIKGVSREGGLEWTCTPRDVRMTMMRVDGWGVSSSWPLRFERGSDWRSSSCCSSSEDSRRMVVLSVGMSPWWKGSEEGIESSERGRGGGMSGYGRWIPWSVASEDGSLVRLRTEGVGVVEDGLDRWYSVEAAASPSSMIVCPTRVWEEGGSWLGV